MAQGDPYASVQRFKAQARTQGNVDETILASRLQHATWLINQESGFETFWESPTASARIFEVAGGSVIAVPAIWSLDDLAVKVDTDGDGDFDDETALGATSYEARPLNAAALSLPWTEIALTRWGSYGVNWPNPGRVQVTAKWGYPGGPPDPVVNLCVEVARMLMGEGIFATNRISEGGAVEETVSIQARSLIRRTLQFLSPTGGIAVG